MSFHVLPVAACASVVLRDTPDSNTAYATGLQVVGVLTLTFIILLQYLFSKADEYGRKHRHVGQLLAAAYRETTLFGIVAFVLFVLETSDVLNSTVLHQVE